MVSWLCLSALCWSWCGIVTPSWNGMFNKTFHVHVQPPDPATLQSFCKKYWLTKFPWGILENDLCPPSWSFSSAETVTLTTAPVHSARDGHLGGCQWGAEIKTREVTEKLISGWVRTCKETHPYLVLCVFFFFFALAPRVFRADFCLVKSLCRDQCF